MGFDPKTMNTTALAYIGDAVYEIYVRERVLAASGQPGRVQAQGSTQAQGFRQAEKERQKAAFGAHVDALPTRAIRYVRADGQGAARHDERRILDSRGRSAGAARAQP